MQGIAVAGHLSGHLMRARYLPHRWWSPPALRRARSYRPPFMASAGPGQTACEQPSPSTHGAHACTHGAHERSHPCTTKPSAPLAGAHLQLPVPHDVLATSHRQAVCHNHQALRLRVAEALHRPIVGGVVQVELLVTLVPPDALSQEAICSGIGQWGVPCRLRWGPPHVPGPAATRTHRRACWAGSQFRQRGARRTGSASPHPPPASPTPPSEGKPAQHLALGP